VGSRIRQELQKIVQRFGKRSTCSGSRFTIRRENWWRSARAYTDDDCDSLLLIEALSEDQNKGRLRSAGKSTGSYPSLPSPPQRQLVGGLRSCTQVSYIRAQVLQVWRDTFLRVLAQVFLIVSLLLDRALEHCWPDAASRFSGCALFGPENFLAAGNARSRNVRPLAREVATMAHSLESGASRRRERTSLTRSG